MTKRQAEVTEQHRKLAQKFIERWASQISTFMPGELWQMEDSLAQLLADREREVRTEGYHLGWRALATLIRAKWQSFDDAHLLASQEQIEREVAGRVRRETLEEVAHFVETHWCENDMHNNYKMHECSPHPNEPLAGAIRALVAKERI